LRHLRGEQLVDAFAICAMVCQLRAWTLTSSSFSKLSLLTFAKADRVASVQMQGGRFGNNEVLITVAPAVRGVPGRP
jgi:hypothetical protein